MAPQAPALYSSVNALHLEATSTHFELSIQELHDLKRHSFAAKQTAYCPYSNFRVGAVVLTKHGEFIPGANVENASYPVGTCAERVAFNRAITDGHRDFKAVAVATDISPPASPCGMCRQTIREFCELQIPVIMFDKAGDYCVLRLEELLPLSFGPPWQRPGAVQENP
ncbi:cytidine deaminase-like protein [Coniella lustricola]|uniref:Cytidine deaminase n=1 Tax=Coniella lustricola TaxID=2025994 RepID=A0A2T3ADJ3_9PEZI|nr:cytidine deaminase-like protein [Coniella lustricola]